MKNDMLRKLILLLAAGLATAGWATQITVGSYNIRVKTPDDKGPNYWGERKGYVARTVTDNGFDVVGFNEVKSGSQQTDLKELLPQYSFYGWDGHEGWRDEIETAVDLVAWRNDKFDFLDGGWFFLSRDLKEWESSWDNSVYTNVRHTSWAKLKVKDTGEVFFVFCTHLDHKGNIARMLQSHLNYEKMWEIAGHYPTIMVGDQNSSTSRANYLNLYKAGFTDAFSVVPDPEAVFGKADPATSGQWNEDPTTGRRIDYIWARGFNVDSYAHCTDKYDLGAMPSDHIAIMAKLTYVDPQLDNRYRYVKAGADGDGSIGAPFGSIQDAVNSAGIGDTIYVAAGDYEITQQIDINRSVRIFGGYDDAFETVSGISAVRPAGDIRGIIIRKETDVEMRNIGVYGANVVQETQDGGAICAHGSRLILRNCELADNYVSRDGGGIDCTGQLILDKVRFLRNKAGRNGGAVCCDNPNKRYWFNFPIEHCYFSDNEAVSGSALYLPRFVYGYVSGNTFSGNKASAGPTVYLHAVSSAPTSKLDANLTVFNNTFTLNTSAGENGASAMFVEIDADAAFSLANNTIVSNTSADGVSAVHMAQGIPYIGNNIVACNTGGDITLIAEGISAAYNLYTTPETINYPLNSHDIYSSDFAGCAAALAGVLDGKLEDGRFIPELTVDTPEPPTSGPDFTVPSVKVVNPVYADGMNLCSVTAMRLREDILKADFNNDCMKERAVSLTVDQIGIGRPADGKATMGAREYDAGSGIDTVFGSTPGDDAPVEYFDLQGRRVANPVPGLYIRRHGTRTDKIIIR